MVADAPRISVIVPFYNTAAYLEGCVRSLTAQTLPHIEILLIDDGSTDASRALAERLAAADARITVLGQPHTGPGAARNRGLESARAPYVTFVDSDDDLTPDACGALLECARASDADIVEARMQTWSRAALQTGINTDLQRLICAMYTGHISMSSCAKLYRRSFLQAHDIRFPPAIYIEDRHFLLRCLIAGARLTPLEQVVYHRHQRPESTMHRVAAKHLADATAAYQLDTAELDRAGLLAACGHHAAWATLVVDLYLARAVTVDAVVPRDALAAEVQRQEGLFRSLPGSRVGRSLLVRAAGQLRRDLARGTGFWPTRAWLAVVKRLAL